jgi:tetratricopeptide (TPR) repeat protein
MAQAMKVRTLLNLLALSSSLVFAQPDTGDLTNRMQGIAQALGVSCNYCHSAERGSGKPEPKKDVARAMMAMTRDLNAKVQSATGKSATEAVRVECVTCHRGVPIPRQLGDIVTMTLREKGLDAAAAQYRDLRTQFYGHSTYDFGEDTLLNVAQSLANSKPDDAIALMKLNLEFYPKSARSYTLIAFAYTRKIDDESAIGALEKALEIEPNNGIVQGQLEQLKSYRRRRN